jgi:hypothetical protein
MPIVQLDPSLINQGGGNAFATAYQNAMANGFKNRASQQELDDNQFKMDALKQDRGQQNALAQLLANQGFDPKSAQGQAQMYGSGGVKNTQGYLKSQGDLAKVNADASKTTAETEKMQLEKHFRKLDLMGQLMGGVQDQASYDQMKVQAAKIPELADLVPSMPPTYDAKAIEIGRQKAMTVKDSMAARHQELTLAETVRRNFATENETRANNIDQTRDRGLTRTQANDHYNLTRGDTLQNRADTQAAGHYDTERGMMISKQGVATPVMSGGVPLGEKDKPLNDSQAKALGFGERMRQSHEIINKLATEGTKANNIGMDTPLIGGLVTAASSGNQQMLKQAKTDFMTALLRRESGAAISQGEYTTADKQYFPQIGDSDGVIAQKAANRELALKGVLQEVPSKQRDSIRPQAATSSQDNAAMSWAKANPNDPRAAKILQHLGR